MHLISINTKRGKLYTFLSLDAFSKLESGDNRKNVGKMRQSKIYLQEINVYLKKIKVVIGF